MSTVLPKALGPMFKPREIKVPDMSHWHVEAEWADGTIDEIGQFRSISDAWSWIAHRSKGWTEDRCN